MQYNNFMTRKNPRIQQRKREDEKSSFFKNSSIILAGIVGFIIPAFYLFGLRFYEGALNAYGINRNSFTLDTIDVYVYGYDAISHVVFNFLNVFATIMISVLTFIIILIVLLLIYRALLSKQGFKKIVHFFKFDNNINDELVERLFNLYTIAILTISTLAVLGVLWIAIPQWAYKKGGYLQNEKIKAYHVQDCHAQDDDWSNCTQILDQNGTKVFEGLLIGVKGDKVAFYEKSGSQVITLKSDQRLYRQKLLEINATK